MCYSTDGYHLPKDIPDECNMVFICEKFEGKVFSNLKQKGFRLVCCIRQVIDSTTLNRILGPSCVLTCALQHKVMLLSVGCWTYTYIFENNTGIAC